MVICDFNAIAIANLMTQPNLELTSDLIRHQLLNSLRFYNSKFRREYGRLVLACDGQGGSWRREIFKEYKSNRKKSREDSAIDWKELFKLLDQIREEIRENLPFRVVRVDHAEADDVVAVMTYECVDSGEPVMIVSGDHDFIQLQRPGVKQFSPMKKVLVKEPDPRAYLIEQVVRGCSGDGVPNILSPDNSFTDSIRQKPVTKKVLDEYIPKVERYLKGQYTPEGDEAKRFDRNARAISFDFIPETLYNAIIAENERAQANLKNNLMNYLIEHRCAQLLESAEDFQATDVENSFIG